METAVIPFGKVMVMTLQEALKKDLIAAMKARDDVRKSVIRIIMGELARLEQKAVPDDDVVKIIKKLIKAEKETLERGGAEQSGYIELLESYLPHMASEEELIAWIDANVDFSQFGNRMQAMKPIMAHFGAGADGNRVKQILQGK